MTLHDRAAETVGKPALQLLRSEEVTLTFFGGSPLSSFRLDWPRRDGRALGFIGQIELSELELDKVAPWIQSTGRLLFFYDMERFPWGGKPSDQGGWVVIHDDGDGPVSTSPFPDDLKDFYRMPQRKHLRGRVYVSIPSIQRVMNGDFEIGEDDGDEYEGLAESCFGDNPRHQIGGYPLPMQDDTMEESCQLASGGVNCNELESIQGPRAEALRKAPNDWRLLLQVDTDDDIEMMWGDAGRLYCWIRESDARVGDFSKVWIHIQGA